MAVGVIQFECCRIILCAIYVLTVEDNFRIEKTKLSRVGEEEPYVPSLGNLTPKVPSSF